MTPRKQRPKEAQRHEMEAFAEKYETLAIIHGDPVDVVFAIMGKAASEVTMENGSVRFRNEDVALKAAELLMSYRYPRVKAAEGNVTHAPVLNFNVQLAAPQEKTITLNPPKAPVFEITSGKKS